jgi:hypothetical protein
MNDTKLSDFELQILKECAGLLPPSPWGAAVGVALEYLQETGYLTIDGIPTDKGKEALK